MRLSAALALSAVASLGLAARAAAADLTVMVTNLQGKPVPNAVVMVKPDGFVAKGPIRFPWPYRMAQKDMQFEPYVLVVPVGAEVSFPNQDPYKHHVYSFSPAHPFELKLYSKEEARTVRFEKVGVVALGCNIHDDMTAFVKVVDTPFAIKSDGRGAAVLHDVPAGSATLTVWHPFLKTKGSEVSRPLTVSAGAATVSFPLDLRSAPLRRGGY